MKAYLGLLKRVLARGDPQYNERTDEYMLVSAGDQSRYDLRSGHPVCTTKSVFMRGVAEELFWILRGERSLERLHHDQGVGIWNRNAFQAYLKRQGFAEEVKKNTPEWERQFVGYEKHLKKDRKFAEAETDLGPVYGYQFRSWPDGEGGHIDQVSNVLKSIREQPGSRYHMISGWNVADLPKMAIGPCHCLYQFTVTRNRDLDLNMFQRSCDVYLGVPFNIASASLLNRLVAQETGLRPRSFIHSYGNVHIYMGVPPRSDFLMDEGNLKEFQHKISWDGSRSNKNFLEIRDWYLENAPAESEGNERKDHVPFILEQLSKTPRERPSIEIADMPFFELIEQPAKEVVQLSGYNPHKWDSKAVMAA